MTSAQIQVTTLDKDERKLSLIEFLQSTDTFSEYNFEGSALNTIIDLLIHDDTYTAIIANMLANESFIDTAQIRGNVVSHAQRLSYVPRSSTASRITGTVKVNPADKTGLTSASVITMQADTAFLTSVDSVSYSFVSNDQYTLRYNTSEQKFIAEDVQLYQGQRITNRFTYSSGMDRVTVSNDRIDRSTMKVIVYPSNALVDPVQYSEATQINELSANSKVYFISENEDGLTEILFGRNIIGVEPNVNAVIEVTYINTEDQHANGASALVAASVIEDYSDIEFIADDVARGGSEKEAIDDVRFLAPYSYQAQNRLLNPVDYEVFVRQRFPFVGDVKAWGGETNNPPLYGVVLLSILTNNFGTVSETVKQQMIETFADYRVGSVTAQFVDPTIFGINVDVSFSIDSTKTSKTRNQLSSDIINVVTSYSDANLGKFTQRYNQSRLIDQIMNLRGVDSVSISKCVYNDLTVLRFNNPNYIISFENELKEGSLTTSSFIISQDATDHLMYDEAGVIYVSYLNSNQSKVTQSVGTINYTTGEVEFSVNFLQTDNTFRLCVETVKDNFIVADDAVAFINEVKTFSLNE